MRALAMGQSYRAAADAVISPTYVPDLVSASLDLLIDGERGIWHLTNQVAVSWAEFGQIAAVRLGLDPNLIDPKPISELGLRGPRPRFSPLQTERCGLMPSLDSAIGRFVIETEHLPQIAA
jgi:dTDP-4-dehydrorhamnose reductase